MTKITSKAYYCHVLSFKYDILTLKIRNYSIFNLIYDYIPISIMLFINITNIYQNNYYATTV